MRIVVCGTAAHGSTPWLGDNAVLKAIDVFRRIESMPFARESSELFDRPSINLGRIVGGDAAEQGARPLHDGRRRPLPARPGPGRDPRPDPRDPGRRRGRARSSAPPAIVSPHQPVRARAARRVARLDRRRGDERRPRRRLRRDRVPRGRHPGGRVRARPAAATTGPTSGSRSRRWRATAARSSTSSRGLPERLADDGADELRGRRGGPGVKAPTPRGGRGAVGRLIAGVADDRAVGATAVASAVLLEIHDGRRRRSSARPRAGGRSRSRSVTQRRGGRAADDPHPRLRPALRRQEARSQAALGHDHARPRRIPTRARSP